MFFLELDLYFHLHKQESQEDTLKYGRLKSLNNSTMLYPITLVLLWLPATVVYSIQQWVFSYGLITFGSVICSLQGAAVMLIFVLHSPECRFLWKRYIIVDLLGRQLQENQVLSLRDSDMRDSDIRQSTDTVQTEFTIENPLSIAQPSSIQIELGDKTKQRIDEK